MLVMDITPIPKARAYYVHHTSDTNRSGSDLIVERALALYFLLMRQPVYIGMIISRDMDVISQSPKKSLGHATVILLLYQKAGAKDLDDWHMLKPTRSLYPAWLRENIVARSEQRPSRHPHADKAG